MYSTVDKGNTKLGLSEALPSKCEVCLPRQLPVGREQLRLEDIKVHLFQPIQPQPRRHGGHEDAKGASHFIPLRLVGLDATVLVALLALMLELMANVPPRTEIVQHLLRSDEMVARPSRDREHGIPETGRLRTVPEHIFLPDARLRHDIQRQDDRTLLRSNTSSQSSLARLTTRRRRWKRDQRHPPQHGRDPRRLADVRGQMVRRQRRHRQRRQRQVQQRRVRVLGVRLERREGRVRRVGQRLLARVDQPHEPALADARAAVCPGVQVRDGGGQQDRDGFPGRRGARERLGDGVAPELEAHEPGRVRGGGVGDHGEGDVERAQGDVEGLRLARDEGAEGVGGAVIFPIFVSLRRSLGED